MSCYNLKIAGIVQESIVDGPGIRYVVFTQGCPHHCPGCHNPQTHDFNGGKEIEIEKIVEEISENPLLKGITLSGGEPFMQAKALRKLVDSAKEINPKLDIMTYSGFTYEELIDRANEENGFKELLEVTNILIDGRFEIDKKKEGLKFRGSSNQRAINVQESLKKEITIEYNF